jgi:aminopeptidase-like protein
MMDFITWSDGTKPLIEIAEKCAVPIWDLHPLVDKLQKHALLAT